MSETQGSWLVGIIIAIVVVGLLVGVVIVIANVKVYTKELSGKADLKEAEWSRQIAVEEAKAIKESATLKAEAEVERAKGVAEANDIIADGLGGAEGYLRYLYISTLEDLETQLIYVPTEAGLPILEANRR
jgi:regulator of protease activity HflC (stomatin/prohibitin superfamily)